MRNGGRTVYCRGIFNDRRVSAWQGKQSQRENVWLRVGRRLSCKPAPRDEKGTGRSSDRVVQLLTSDRLDRGLKRPLMSPNM